MVRGARLAALVDETAVAPGHEEFGSGGFDGVPEGVVILVDEENDEFKATLIGQGKESAEIRGLFFGSAVDHEFALGKLQALGGFVGFDHGVGFFEGIEIFEEPFESGVGCFGDEKGIEADGDEIVEGHEFLADFQHFAADFNEIVQSVGGEDGEIGMILS